MPWDSSFVFATLSIGFPLQYRFRCEHDVRLWFRFSRYTQSREGFIGPSRDGRELVKRKLFEDLQRRRFRLFFRHVVCRSPVEPSITEEILLRQMDYAGNERANNGYRQLMIGDKRLTDFPVRTR